MAALLGVVTVLAWPVGPAAAAGPYTSYAISGDAGDSIVGNHGYGGTSVYFDGDSSYIGGQLGEWALAIAPAHGDHLSAGQTYPITGAPAAPHDGAALSLWGHDQSCMTTSGTFTVDELTFDDDAKVTSVLLTFTVRCGDAPAQAYGSVAWQASTAPPPVPPALSLRVSTGDKKVDYGTTETAQARVTAGVPGQTVLLYRRTNGGADELIAQAPANAQGIVTVGLRVTETTTVTARIQGNTSYPDRVVTQTVPVRGKLKATVLNKGPTRHGVRLISLRHDALVGAVLLPDHHSDCIKFRLELLVRGAWGYHTTTRCLELNKNSAVAVRVPADRRLRGIQIRVRAQWKGDNRNLATHSKWTHLQFVA